MKNIFYYLLLLVLGSCSFKQEYKDFIKLDLSPPSLISIKDYQKDHFLLEFSEPFSLLSHSSQTNSGETLFFRQSHNKFLEIISQEKLVPGKEYTFPLKVEDRAHNTCSYILKIWGRSENQAEVILNEVATETSAYIDDSIELLVLKEGNLGGLTLYLGSETFYSAQYICPSIDVKEGDFVLIHFKYINKDENKKGIDEINGNKALSKGKLSRDSAWDLWAKRSTSITGTNGAISIYSSPLGQLIDCLIYSNRTSQINDPYLGWTTSSFACINDLYNQGGWIFSDANIKPEEALFSEYFSGTRTASRWRDKEDTNTKLDWYTVENRGATLGAPNTSLAYIKN